MDGNSPTAILNSIKLSLYLNKYYYYYLQMTVHNIMLLVFYVIVS